MYIYVCMHIVCQDPRQTFFDFHFIVKKKLKLCILSVFMKKFAKFAASLARLANFYLKTSKT